MTGTLSAREMARWVAWKQATEAVMAAVVSQISAATGLSGADFSVLTRVVEEQGGDGIRQQRLSDSLGWERSRLSRQLERMEQRGLLLRSGSSVARHVTATATGHSLAEQARGIHADAVRRHLLRAVPRADAAAFWRAVGGLAAAVEPAGAPAATTR